MTTKTSTALLTPRPAPTPTGSEVLAAPLWKGLAPLCLIVFMEFLAMGLPLPILPLHVHGTLGFGSFIVGLAVAAQSWATLLTRQTAGTWSDRRGPRGAAVLGLALSGGAGTLYALSTALHSSSASLVVLLVGRALLGAGESLVITSTLSWGIAFAGRQRTGVVMAWIGIAMYGAFAAGAPLGTWLNVQLGFSGVSAAASAAPLMALAVVALAPTVGQLPGAGRLPFHRVVRLIWLPGLGLMLSALGFGAIAAFSTLRFGREGWAHAPLAMTAFGASYVVARLVFGRFPDRFGGARVAMVATGVAAVGQIATWLAGSAAMAIVAAAVTGVGFSLAFPSFGIEAIRSVPPQNRGAALGAYTACFDAAMGIGVPALGMIAGDFGYKAAFGVGAATALAGLTIAVVVWDRSRRT